MRCTATLAMNNVYMAKSPLITLSTLFNSVTAAAGLMHKMHNPNRRHSAQSNRVKQQKLQQHSSTENAAAAGIACVCPCHQVPP
jgi:hypothetical protein